MEKDQNINIPESSPAPLSDAEKERKSEAEITLEHWKTLEENAKKAVEEVEKTVEGGEDKVLENPSSEVKDLESADKVTEHAKAGINNAAKELEGKFDASGEKVWGKEKEGVGKVAGKTLLGVAGTWLGVRSPFEIFKYIKEKKAKKETTSEAKKMLNDVGFAVSKIKKLEGLKERREERDKAREKAAEAVKQTREKIKNSNLSAQEKAQLWREVAKVSREYQSATKREGKSYSQRMESVMDAYIDTKAQGIRAVKESLNTAFMVAGMPWMRVVAYAPLDIAEKYAKSVQEIRKKELKGAETGKSAKLLETGKKVLNEISFGAAFAKKGRSKTEITKDAIKGMGAWLRLVGLEEIARHGIENWDDVQKLFSESVKNGNLEGSVNVEWKDAIDKNIADVSAAAHAKEVELATIHKGEGIEHSLIRQLQAHPSEHGFKGDVSDADAVKKWAGVEAHKIAIKEGFYEPAIGVETRLKYNPDNPTVVLLKDDNTVEITNAETYKIKTFIPPAEEKMMAGDAEALTEKSGFETTVDVPKSLGESIKIGQETQPMISAEMNYVYDSNGKLKDITFKSMNIRGVRGTEYIDLSSFHEWINKNNLNFLENVERSRLTNEGINLTAHIRIYEELNKQGKTEISGVILNKIKEDITNITDKYGKDVVKIDELKKIIK